MADQQCRVTVVGQRRRVDLAVPATAPIGEYVGELAGMCGESDDDAMPAAWSLAPYGMPALSPALTLAAVGINDGEVLYLRDVSRGEADEPTIFDIMELVAEAVEETDGIRWNVPARAMAMVSIGVLWLAAMPLAVAITGLTVTFLLPGLVALTLGLALPVLARTARRGQWQVRPAAQVIMALAAIPNLAGATWLLGRDWFPPGALPIGVAVAATLGAFLALVTMPGLVTAATQIVTVVVLLVAVLLVRMSATGLDVAATVAIVGYGLLSAAPWTVGHLAAFWPAPDGPSDDPEAAAKLTVIRGRRQLVAWHVGAAVVIGVALVFLATSANLFAVALAACLCVPLAWRAGRHLMLVEAMPTVLAACAAGFIVLIRLSALWPGLPPTFGFSLTWLAGSVVLVTGLSLMFRRDPEPQPERKPLRILAALCVVAAIPLVLAVYGVFDRLSAMGSHL